MSFNNFLYLAEDYYSASVVSLTYTFGTMVNCRPKILLHKSATQQCLMPVLLPGTKIYL